ncbi:MAG: hypothetical protein AAGA03_01100 [Planctomycetota bacterium]
MTNSQRLATVRQYFAHWLSRQPDAASANGQPIESILIRGGFYCGRRFDAGIYVAVWFMEEDQLKISRPDGQVVASLSGSEISVPEQVRRAA